MTKNNTHKNTVISNLFKVFMLFCLLPFCNSPSPSFPSAPYTDTNFQTNNIEVQDYRTRAKSDDARTIEEAFFHGNARGLVISKIEPNKLKVGGDEFRVKRNPVGEGCFVYDSRTRFNGVERLLVWWIPNEGTAYALNSPSKMVTPSIKWPREDGVKAPNTNEVVAYVFQNKPMAPSPKTASNSDPSVTNSFTVREYRIYRFVIDTPMSVPEHEVLQNVARRYEITAAEAKKSVQKVMLILFQNDWRGSPESEIKHAFDWAGEKQ